MNIRTVAADLSRFIAWFVLGSILLAANVGPVTAILGLIGIMGAVGVLAHVYDKWQRGKYTEATDRNATLDTFTDGQ